MHPGMYSRRIKGAAGGGGGGGAVRVDGGNYSSYDTTGNPSVSVSFGNSGLCTSYAANGGEAPANYTWLLTGVAADYEIYATNTNTSGSAASGTFGTWLPLSTSRSWSSTRSTTGENINTVTITIRPISGGAGVTADHYFQVAKNT